MPALASVTGYTCACVEYRLAPVDKHPAQALDVISALNLLSSPSLLSAEQNTPRWDRSKIYIMGHSAGAFIALSIVLKQPADDNFDKPTFRVPTTTRQAVKGVICVDGIYDLPNLLEEYASYESFVNDAFGLDPEYLQRESPARWELHGADDSQRLRLLVLHSKQDELLSMRQPEDFAIKMRWLLQQTPERGQVETDYESVTGTHDGLLKSAELPHVVKDWITRVEQREGET